MAVSPGRGREQVDQLAGQNGYVSACHVKKDGQGAPSTSTISAIQLPPGRSASGRVPRPRCGPDAHHDDLLLDARVLEQRRRSVTRPAESSSISNELPREEARELAVLRAHRVEAAEDALDDRLEGLGRPDRDAGLGRLGENHSVRERRRGTSPARSAGSLRPASGRSARGKPMSSIQQEKKLRTEVAEWEEPRHSGRLMVATVPHSAPTLQHISPLFPSARARSRPLRRQSRSWSGVGRGERRVGGSRSQRCSAMRQDGRMGAILRADDPACRRWRAGREASGCGLGAGAASPRRASSADSSAAATSSSTEGTSSSATTSWIFGPARAASSRDVRGARRRGVARLGGEGVRRAGAVAARRARARPRAPRPRAAAAGGACPRAPRPAARRAPPAPRRAPLRRQRAAALRADRPQRLGQRAPGLDAHAQEVEQRGQLAAGARARAAAARRASHRSGARKPAAGASATAAARAARAPRRQQRARAAPASAAASLAAISSRGPSPPGRPAASSRGREVARRAAASPQPQPAPRKPRSSPRAGRAPRGRAARSEPSEPQPRPRRDAPRAGRRSAACDHAQRPRRGGGSAPRPPPAARAPAPRARP